MKKFNRNQLAHINKQLNNNKKDVKISKRDKIEMEKVGVTF